MADKDEFKFDDDDTFPETDLSGAFSEGEQSAPPEPEYPMTIKKAGGGKTRLLLFLLLLVVAGGGAYYYFMMMEEPAPPPPPPKKAVVTAPAPVPVPAPVPPPAPAPAPVAAPAPAAAPAPVAVAPPPKPAAPAPVPAPAAAPAAAPAKPAAVAVAPPPKPAAAPAPAPAPAPAKPAAVAAAPPAKPAAATVAPAPAKPAVAAPAPAKPEARPAATGGPWLVEAGTFVNAAALKDVEKKIRALGYEPQVSTTQKVVRMTRLRLGSFPESEVKEALAYARGIAPDAFALRAGETYTVYAGTFTSAQNVRQMSERLVSEGVQVEEEPLEVKRTISLVRFGGFADQAAAKEAAARARKVGIAAEAVGPR